MQCPTAKSQSASCNIVNKICAEGINSKAEVLLALDLTDAVDLPSQMALAGALASVGVARESHALQNPDTSVRPVPASEHGHLALSHLDEPGGGHHRPHPVVSDEDDPRFAGRHRSDDQHPRQGGRRCRDPPPPESQPL